MVEEFFRSSWQHCSLPGIQQRSRVVPWPEASVPHRGLHRAHRSSYSHDHKPSHNLFSGVTNWMLRWKSRVSNGSFSSILLSLYTWKINYVKIFPGIYMWIYGEDYSVWWIRWSILYWRKCATRKQLTNQHHWHLLLELILNQQVYIEMSCNCVSPCLRWDFKNKVEGPEVASTCGHREFVAGAVSRGGWAVCPMPCSRAMFLPGTCSPVSFTAVWRSDQSRSRLRPQHSGHHWFGCHSKRCFSAFAGKV